MKIMLDAFSECCRMGVKKGEIVLPKEISKCSKLYIIAGLMMVFQFVTMLSKVFTSLSHSETVFYQSTTNDDIKPLNWG
jgi:hypothetical protein